MGVWGTGNFENDYANDFLGKILLQYKKDIEAHLSLSKLSQNNFLEIYGEYEAMPLIDIFITLCTTYDAMPNIDLEQSKQWRQLYLKAFDEADGMYGDKFKIERRLAIEETFDRLDNAILSWQSEE